MDVEHVAALNVLVLEDDDSIREALIDALTLEGFVVNGAANLQEAFDAVLAGKIDAALVDLRLADGELGRDFIVRFLDDPAAPVMVLLSSSNELARPVVAEFNLPWLTKPFDLDRLITTIRGAVGTRARPRRSTPLVAAAG